MGTEPPEVNEAQRAVMEWVAAGSPADVMEGYSHRISARALQFRGLLKISGKGPTWRAELTDAGRAFLRAEPTTSSEASDDVEPLVTATTAPSPSPTPKPKAPSVTEQLVADVVAAGGVLRVKESIRPGDIDYRQRAYAAQRFGKVPVGKQLTTAYIDG